MIKIKLVYDPKYFKIEKTKVYKSQIYHTLYHKNNKLLKINYYNVSLLKL